VRVPSTVESKTWIHQASVLREAALAIARGSSDAELYELLVRRIAQLDGFKVGQAYLTAIGPGRPHWCAGWYSGPDAERFVDKSRRLGQASAVSLPMSAAADRGVHVLNPPIPFRDEARKAEADRAGLRAGFAVPIVVSGSVSAVLEFYRSEPILPDDPSLLVAEALAAHVGTAIALQTTKAQFKELRARWRSESDRSQGSKSDPNDVRAITAGIHGEMPTLRMVRGSIDSLRAAIRLDAVAAYGIRPAGTPNRIAASVRDGLHLPDGDTEIARTIIQCGCPSEADERDEALRSVFGIPLVVEQEVVGALVVFHHTPESITRYRHRLLQITADRIARRVARAQAIERTWRDQKYLEELSQRLVQAHESERKAISRDLHDEVGQVIAALKYSLDTSGDHSESLRAALGSLMEQVRTIAQRFRPPMIDDMGLAATLDWHLKQFSQQTGVRVRFRQVGASARYHPDLEITLYRIVQEALTNVARHANVPEVRVAFCARPGQIGVRVRDHGAGFDPERIPSGSTGITGMKERLRPFRGHLTVQSRRGRGTSVTATVPLNPEARIMNEPITVVLADDHRILRDALKSLLESASFQVAGEAGDGLEAVSVVERVKPHVLLLDVSMPGLGGVDVVKQVTKRSPRTQVLMLSMYANDAFVNGAMKNGAAGYVLKDAAGEDLFHAIREVAEGRRYLSRPVEESGAADREMTDAYDSLTMREREVLHLAAEGLTSAQIADRLSISPRTAETHRANSLRKLNIRGQTELVRYAIGRGILPAPI
jgi:DNA-binding NarL/FixJ family response regulator/signal transduction histidine kinase